MSTTLDRPRNGHVTIAGHSIEAIARDLDLDPKHVARSVREITLPETPITTMWFRVRGTTPLLTNRFSEEAQSKLEGAQQGAAKVKKAPRNPRADFEGAQYKFPDGRHAIPAIAMKLAMVVAGMRFADERSTALLGVINIPAELLEIVRPAEGDPTPNDEWPRMRTDRVVLSGMARTTSVAYRPHYYPWAIDFPLKFDANHLTVDQVANLVRLAGTSVGIGAWRVEKRGPYGQFEIENAMILHEGKLDEKAAEEAPVKAPARRGRPPKAAKP